MKKIKSLLLMLVCISCSFPIFAENTKLFSCKDFLGISEIKQKIASIDKTFRWDTPSCKIVGTKSVFPRQKNGTTTFEKGLQLFVYHNDQLKFICLPGWVCKQWS